MAETVVNRPSGRWPKRLKIPKSQVAVFRRVAIHILPLVRRPIGYSQLTTDMDCCTPGYFLPLLAQCFQFAWVSLRFLD